jgi:hypothetical protein
MRGAHVHQTSRSCFVASAPKGSNNVFCFWNQYFKPKRSVIENNMTNIVDLNKTKTIFENTLPFASLVLGPTFCCQRSVVLWHKQIPSSSFCCQPFKLGDKHQESRPWRLQERLCTAYSLKKTKAHRASLATALPKTRAPQAKFKQFLWCFAH